MGVENFQFIILVTVGEGECGGFQSEGDESGCHYVVCCM